MPNAPAAHACFALRQLQGLATIHAFDKGKEFTGKFFDLVTMNIRTFFGFYYASRWFAIRLDYVTTVS